MAMNFVFANDDPYNISSLAVFGANPAERAIRLGTGMFRFARGYCQTRMRWLVQRHHRRRHHRIQLPSLP
jgi:hypothetical protein